MILDQEIWMDIRRFKRLHEAGAVTYEEIARECAVDHRSVKRYPAADAPSAPPAASCRQGTQPRVVTLVIEALIRGMLALDVDPKASVIWSGWLQCTTWRCTTSG